MNSEVKDALEACRDFGVPRSSSYEWKEACAKDGKAGLLLKKPMARSHPPPR